jgi:ABC transporter, ATP-binding protein
MIKRGELYERRVSKMKLIIKNIGKLKNAEVEINGITVITGENNTGKSTVGKTLFSLFYGFYDLDKKISMRKIGDIENIFLRFVRNMNSENLKKIINISDKIEKKVNYNKDEISRLLQENESFIPKENLEDVSEKISNIIKITSKSYLENMISYIFNIEFDSQINTIGSNYEGRIILRIKEDEIKIAIKRNEIAIENEINLRSEVIYIDDPFVIDNLNEYKFKDIRYLENHKENLETKLFRENNEINISERIILANKLEQINEKLEKVIDGEIKLSQGRWIYEFKNNKELNLKNLSTGLKSFAILKRLIENGNLKENGTVILDEPEIHLHPEWQLLFAELIVLLQKEFGMHILLTTHSPYFLNAIEVYSEKYKINEKCKYYIAENTTNGSIIKDMTGNTRNIYRKLARPIQELENIRYSDLND